MILLVKLFGVIVVCMGIIFLINPAFLRQYISFWKQEKRLRIGGIVSLVFGIVFLIAASQCRLAWLIAVLGIWAIIKGVLLLTIGQEKIIAYIDWWLGRPVSTIRFLGLIALAFGALIFYSA